MSNSEPSLTNINSLMNAAEVEANNLQEPSTGQIVGSEPAVTPSDVPINSLPQIPGLNILGDVKDIKDALNSANLSSVLSKISDDPGEVGRIMTESMGHMTPAMMEQARKLAQGGQGDQIKREMLKMGMDPRQMQVQLKEQRRQQRSLDKLLGKVDNNKRVVLITSSRQLKGRMFSSTSFRESIAHAVHTLNPVELSCSRLAVGPLEGKTVKLWYNPERKGKNQRSSKIIGFPIAGEAVIVMDEGDLTEEMVSAAEKLLV